MNPADATPDQGALIAALLNPAAYSHPVERVEKLETHISYVLLAGSYVYKIKKAVDLGFLDFRTLKARRFYCEEELRLNRRLAPALYIGIVPISGSAERPVLGGDGPAIEYAVKMHRFPQDQLFNALLARNEVAPRHIDQLARKLADFHASADVAGANDAFGTPEAVRQPALENFAQIRATHGTPPGLAALDALEAWTVEQSRALADVFAARKHGGHVRECHGDFHTGNVALINGEVTLFDCLEFSAALRWIDVMNEAAFLVMDLRDKKRLDLARRFLNCYLELTGDYEGLCVLRYYVVYRALVRAKVHWLRANQLGARTEDKPRLIAQYLGYLDLATMQSRLRQPALIITHGLSGSGKTTHTQSLVETIDAVRIRSDVERKRMLGLPSIGSTDSSLEDGAYTADATTLTYDRLLALAKTITAAGYTAIVDATFLKHEQREAFRRLAQARRLPFLIVDFAADEAALRARIGERRRRRDDASEADLTVLNHQLQTQEPLQPDEQPAIVTYDSTQPPNDANRATRWSGVLDRLGRISG